MLQKATADFLIQLDKNNNKPWFDANRSSYESAKKDFEQFIDAVLREAETLIPELAGRKAKDAIFRIYKDVRFAKDKTPYKNNMGAGFGKFEKNKMNAAGYYIHFQPGACFVGGGLWMPDSPGLKAIRQEIDYNWTAFQSIVGKASFKKMFGTLDQDQKLKTLPKGYDADNPAIEYLKLKSFTVGRPLQEEEFYKKNAVKMILDSIKEMKPFVDFLNTAVEV
ncbi:MAG: DUF2461 domain-containing protein [Chitinophagaceae bacterium]